MLCDLLNSKITLVGYQSAEPYKASLRVILSMQLPSSKYQNDTRRFDSKRVELSYYERRQQPHA
jgi:hypothetical protein